MLRSVALSSAASKTAARSAERIGMAGTVLGPRGTVDAADSAALSAAFYRGGAVHVRGAIGAASIASLHDAADGLFRSWTASAAAGRLPAALEVPLRRRFIPLASIPMLEGRVDSLVHPSFRELAQRYLGKEPVPAPDSHLRSIVVDRPDAHLPYHQDQTIVGCRLLNVWIPLDACGGASPGLEVIWDSWQQQLDPAPEPGAAFPVERARLDPEMISKLYGEAARWMPHFEPGDAMVFSGATIHRTHVNAGMSGQRMSVEIRLL
jgi:hypothetical protein